MVLIRDVSPLAHEDDFLRKTAVQALKQPFFRERLRRAHVLIFFLGKKLCRGGGEGVKMVEKNFIAFLKRSRRADQDCENRL